MKVLSLRNNERAWDWKSASYILKWTMLKCFRQIWYQSHEHSFRKVWPKRAETISKLHPRGGKGPDYASVESWVFPPFHCLCALLLKLSDIAKKDILPSPNFQISVQYMSSAMNYGQGTFKSFRKYRAAFLLGRYLMISHSALTARVMQQLLKHKNGLGRRCPQVKNMMLLNVGANPLLKAATITQKLVVLRSQD